MGLKLTENRFRYSRQWKCSVVCAQCYRPWRLQYPKDVSPLYEPAPDVLDYKSKCKCGSWYAVNRYTKDGL